MLTLSEEFRPCTSLFTAGKYTVPVLWDKKTSTIVNNESADIVRMLNARFNTIAKKVRCAQCSGDANGGLHLIGFDSTNVFDM